MNWISLYILIWLSVACLSGLFVRFCMVLAPKWGFLDIPLHEAHKRHRAPVPVLGGLGMMLGWLLPILCGGIVVRFFPQALPAALREHIPGALSVSHRLLVIVLAAVAAAFLGMCDDHHPLSALPKFGGQFVIALVLVLCGLKISFLHSIPGANELVSLFWILMVMNALNFFDNMDGLAAGACIVAAFVFLFVAGWRCQYFVAALAALTGGAATGFFLYNAAPAKIFMGDGGSHFLGVLLSICGILTTFYVPGENPTPAPILIPLFALGVPLFDAIAVVIIRLRLHVPIYKGDNRHISHRFARLGLSRPLSVFLVHLLCFVVGVSGLTLLWLPPAGSILVLLVLSAVFLLISILQFRLPEVKQ